MIKRTIEISDGPTFLCIELDQLVLQRQGAEIGRVPVEDIGLLIVDHHSTTYTQAVFTRLLNAGAGVVVCDQQHLPAGILLPYQGNELVAQRVALQAAVKLPVKKRLWQQIVRHKIRGQVKNLPGDDPAGPAMLELARRVRSADASNCEGQAAALYWPAIFGGEFRRDRFGLPPNNLLNYGYMVLRAAVARAIASAGLHPAFGLHHHHRNNAFCLADDLVEVFRPMVDGVVIELALLRRHLELDRQSKQLLLGLLTREVKIGEQTGPLMVGLHRMMGSLVRCYEGLQQELDLPDL
jgi:CRISPR-associated protein Cas1